MSVGGIEIDDEVGVKALAATDDAALLQALAEPPIEPELYEELLSDAHGALFQGHLRQAVLELAISCEVATRQAFFIKAPRRRYQNQKLFPAPKPGEQESVRAKLRRRRPRGIHKC